MKRKAMKKTISILVCVIMICGLIPAGLINAFATETIVNINNQIAEIVQSSTVYAGEVFVDGESTVKYLYSDDITRSTTVLAAVLDAFRAMDDKGFAPLVPGVVGEDGKGLVECSTEAYADEMDESWKDAGNVAKKYYPDLPLTASSSVDLYETDSAFAAACGKHWTQEQLVDTVGNPFEMCGPIGDLSAVNTDTITYTVIDGQLVEIIDRDINYTCESITVIYTRAEVGDNYKGFPDVAKGDWYYDAVKYCATRGFITGYKNGKFGPGDTLKRQDFVVILARIAGADLTSYENVQSTMPDVVKGSYYAAAVNWAVDNGIIGGYTSGANKGKFGVGDNITREQVCVILYRYMGSPAVTGATNTLKPFADANRISSFAKDAVVWAIQNGVISGKNSTTLAPTATASRAEIATIVMRMDKAGMFAA